MSTSLPADTRAATVKQLRKMRLRKMGLRLFLAVGLPTMAAAAWYGFIVTPRYESVTTFTIQSADGGAAIGGALEMLMGGAPGGSATRDVMLVQEYVQSRDMLRHLITEHEYVAAYSRASADFASRLSADAGFEEIYEYYIARVSIDHDSASGVLTLRVQAFDRENAHRIGQAILAASEEMVNRLSESARTDRIELARSELARAEGRLSTARRALRELQAEHGDLNPRASAEAILAVRSRLEGELAIARADLSTLRATMPRTSPEVTAARYRVGALSAEIEDQSARLTSGRNDGISAELAVFEPVMIEKEFAQRAYESALTSLELARVDASRQHRYLVRISGPSQPDQPRFPRFWYSVLTVLVLSFALLGVGTLLIASVREHANV